MYSDSELIQLLEQKDQDACDFLYERYAGALHGLILQILPEDEDNGDLLENSFRQIIQRIKEYDASNSRLFTWMMQVTRQTALRKLHGITPLTGSVDQDNPVSVGRTGIAKLINNLDPVEKKLIQLSYLQGYSPADVARQMNLPEETVNSRLRFALSHLKSLL